MRHTCHFHGNLYLFQDVDECLSETDNCVHVCSNTEGGFDCSCQPGYRLEFDKHSCEGMKDNDQELGHSEPNSSTQNQNGK